MARLFWLLAARGLWGEQRPGPLRRVRAMEAVGAYLGFLARRLKACEWRQSKLSWQDHLWQVMESGAGRVYRAMKAKVVRPPDGTDPDGCPTSVPSRMLAGERVRWGAIWQASMTEEEQAVEVADLVAELRSTPTCPEPISVEAVRTAARSFKFRTVALDGVHPRAYGMVIDVGVEATAALLYLLDLVSTFPDDVAEVVIDMIDKPKGGLRPIGWYRSLVRLLGRIRRQVTRSWDMQHRLRSFNAQAGVRTSEGAWRQRFLMEAGTAGGSYVLGLLWGLLKAFDHVAWRILWRLGRQHDYPLHRLKVAIIMYVWPRRLHYKGMVVAVVYPHRGITAGAYSATAELKLMLFELAYLHEVEHPDVSLLIHVDDISQETTGGTEEQCSDRLVASAQAFEARLCDWRELPLAIDKQQLLASHASLAERFCAQYGIDMGGVSSQAELIWGRHDSLGKCAACPPAPHAGLQDPTPGHVEGHCGAARRGTKSRSSPCALT